MRQVLTLSLMVACAIGLVVMIFVDGPDIITDQVTGLKLEQDGYNIEVSWDELEPTDAETAATNDAGTGNAAGDQSTDSADNSSESKTESADHQTGETTVLGYDITIKGPGRNKKIEGLKDTHYTIKDIEFDEEYTIEVSAILSSGWNSREAEKTLMTQRLPQKITVNIKKYNGFARDVIGLKSKGKGEVTYTSTREKIASVSESGMVKLLKTGHGKIEVKYSGNDTYRPASVLVDVNVYPETLARAGKPKKKYISDSRAKLTWKKVDFALGYDILKENKETGKYEKIDETDGGETQIELTRDTGNYAVKAKAKIQDKKITGKRSKSVKIEGTTEDAESYSSGKNIMSLNSSNLDLIRVINGSGSTNVPQSISLTDDCYVVSYVNQGGSAGKLISYKRGSGEFVAMSSCSGMGYANGTTYNPNTNKFYVVKTHKSYRTASCSTYDGTTKESRGTFSLPRVTSGIAYDESNNKYYLSKGNEIYVCDSNFKVEKFIHKFVRYNHAQDIGSYNGTVLVCTWVSGSTSYIDMYRASDGAYLGSYNVSIGEIESCVVDDGYLIILMNTIGSSKDRLYRTKERISIP